MVAAGSYLLLRLSPAIAAEGLMGPALALFGAVTFAGAALLAMREHDLKRVLAYSTVSSLGLVASAAGLGSPAALAAGTLLLAFHAVAKAAAFLAVGTIEQLSGTRDTEALVGAGRRRPGVAALLLLAAAALTLPPFGIVVAKWALLVLGASDVSPGRPSRPRRSSQPRAVDGCRVADPGTPRRSRCRVTGRQAAGQ